MSLHGDLAALDAEAERAAGRQDAPDLKAYHAQEIEEMQTVMASLDSMARLDPAVRATLQDGGAKLLADIGCGAAGALAAWSEWGWSTLGVEPGEPGRFASEKRGLDVRVERYSATTFAAESLGMIYSYHSLEHFERPFEAIPNCARHLEPGGLMYIETPDVLDADRPQLGYDHWSLFSLRTLRGAIEAAGFEVVGVVDRSGYGTHGVAVPARKRSTAFDSPREFLPGEAIRWNRHSYWAMRFSMRHAFHGGRGRDLRRLGAPYHLARTSHQALSREGACEVRREWWTG